MEGQEMFLGLWSS